jgi:hypothetical protein
VQRRPLHLLAGLVRHRRGTGDRVQQTEIGGEGQPGQARPAVLVRIRPVQRGMQPDQVGDPARRRHAHGPGQPRRDPGAPAPRAVLVQQRGQDADEPVVTGPPGRVEAGDGLPVPLAGQTDGLRQRVRVGGRAGTHRPQRGPRTQPVLDDGRVHPVRVRPHVPGPHPLRDAVAELLRAEAVHDPDDVPLLPPEIQPQRAQRPLVEHAPPQDRRYGDPEFAQKRHRPVPVQAASGRVPHREAVEPAVQVVVGEGVAGEHVLPAHPPALRDGVADSGLERLDPGARGVVRGVERAGVQAVGVQRGVLAVQLLGHDDLATAQAGQVGHPEIVGGGAGGPGKMSGPRIVRTHGERPP